jgi:ribonuclease HII
MIVGIDEVGRGSWAGPLCVGAVALGGLHIDGLTDSKLLSKKKRELYAKEIKQNAPRVGIGWVSARDIDSIGISQALKLAARRALQQIDGADIEQIIIDGTIRLIDDPRVTTMKKADLLVPSVSAASVIAKVARDEYMSKCHDLFDGYGWKSNVGYGAAIHKTAIDEIGVTPLHRMSFAPMKLLPVPTAPVVAMTSKSLGDKAEGAAAVYLEEHGFRVVERNWKTKWCEIDIVAKKQEVLYFVEVKYRKTDHQGGGIAAITPKKLDQMTFAARLWMQRAGQSDARLSAIEVSGSDFSVTQFLEQVG